MLRHLIIAGLIQFVLICAAWNICASLCGALKRLVCAFKAKLRNRPTIASIVFGILRFALRAIFARRPRTA